MGYPSDESYMEDFELLILNCTGSANDRRQDVGFTERPLVTDPMSKSDPNDLKTDSSTRSPIDVLPSDGRTSDDEHGKGQHWAADVERLRAFLAYILTVDYNMRTHSVPDLSEQDKRVYQDCQALFCQIDYMEKNGVPRKLIDARRNHPLLRRFIYNPCLELQIEIDYVMSTIQHYLRRQWTGEEHDEEEDFPYDEADRYGLDELASRLFHERESVVVRVIPSEELKREFLRQIEWIIGEQYEWIQGRRGYDSKSWPADKFVITYEYKHSLKCRRPQSSDAALSAAALTAAAEDDDICVSICGLCTFICGLTLALIILIS